MSNNLATVKEMYTLFGQGNIPAILSHFADGITMYNGADPAQVPFGGSFTGEGAPMRYFSALGGATQTTLFETSNFREEDGKILNDVRHGGIVTSTGKPFDVNMTFAWTFDDAGKASDWKANGDFSSLYAAFKG